MPAADEVPLIATLLTNRELAPVVLAAWDRGDAVLPLNPALPRAQLDALIAQARPTHLLDDDGMHSRADGEPVPADTAAIVCTSGTTGGPKAVELTRVGLDAMGRGVSAAVGANDSDRWLACHPLFFVAGLAILGRSWVTGVPVTVHDGFDLERVAASPRHDGVTIVSVVPTTLRRLVRGGAAGAFRAVVVGGAPLPEPQRADALATGVDVYDAYGLTETWGGCVTNGLPNDGVEARLIEGGEVALRGAPVMRAYRFDAERSAAALTVDGWLRTGDVGAIDGDGRLTIVDRLKDLIISGGVNVSPTEVEGVIADDDHVADVCVIGEPDDEWGERVVACVVARDAARPPTLDALRSLVRDRLGAPAAPKELRLVDSIPRSASGKPLRRELRARL
jgi:O-succinylbenzoic acid--CoA ligase